MSTNTNNIGLPSTADLEHIANELFKTLPNEFPKEISLNPSRAEHPKATKIAETLLGANSLGSHPITNYDTVLAQSSFAPLATTDLPSNPNGTPQTLPSFGGFGGTPSGAPYGSSGVLGGFPSTFSDSTIENLYQQEQVVPANKETNISSPKSGDGTTPYAIQTNNSINLEKPQTSFYDENLYNQEQKTNFPFEISESIFEKELQSALALITSNNTNPFGSSKSQLENSNSYYFLEDKPFSLDARKSDIPLDSKTPSGIFLGSNFNAHLIKKDFPILNERVNGKPLIWFDNAATTQKPKLVIDRVSYFYEHENSNIHRAAHELAARASDAYEASREKVKVFLNAGSINEIVFVRGATEGINLVAESWGNQNLVAGDEIVVSNLEHHANIVPWKRLADKKGLKLRVIPVDDDGQILLDEYAKLLNPKTRLVAFTQVSNALGTVTPAKQMVEMAHAVGAKVLLDGAQSVSHMKVDVQYLNADWLVFSGHKLFGPTGIGVLYGKETLLNEMEPYQSGGNMIQDVTFEHIKYHKAPNRFEAGTGNIADAIGLGAAIDYVSQLGIESIGQYEHYLLEYATQLLKQIPGVRLIGAAANKASVLSFTLHGFTNDEVGQALNREGIAVRTGHHCAQPILRRMGVETSVRPSLAFYNTPQDVDVFIETLWKLKSRKN
jgi:cysteine desulfurase/selenocysteine lyase